jgi:hypothetical protein
MKLARALSLALGGIAALAFTASPAQARNSRDRRERRGIMSDRTKDEREKDDRERKREETRKQAEERKKQKEEKKKAEAEQRKAAAEKRKAVEEEARKARAAARAKPAEARAAKAKPERAADDEADEKAAAKLVADAEKEFADGNLLPGVTLLREALQNHRGTEAAEAAQARLDQLLALEPFGPTILLGEGEECFAERRYRQALNKYNELLQRFPNSEQAATGQQRIAEIRDGDLLSQSVYSPEELEDARLWLLVGNIHLENGRRGEATAAYRKVIEEFPGCRFAKQATEMLAAVPET